MTEISIPAKYFRTNRRYGPPRLITIHTAECDFGAALGVAAWEASGGGADQASSHLIIGPDIVIRCVADECTAFTQGSPWNDYSLSIEMTGRASYTQAQWRSPEGQAQMELVAHAIATWCTAWDIPPVMVEAGELANIASGNVSGITCHWCFTECDQANPGQFGSNNHSDPGPNYPMDRLIARVVEILHPPTEDTMPTITTRIQPFEGVTTLAPGQWLTPELATAVAAGQPAHVVSRFHAQGIASVLAIAGVDGRALSFYPGESLTANQRAELAALGITAP